MRANFFGADPTTLDSHKTNTTVHLDAHTASRCGDPKRDALRNSSGISRSRVVILLAALCVVGLKEALGNEVANELLDQRRVDALHRVDVLAVFEEEEVRPR